MLSLIKLKAWFFLCLWVFIGVGLSLGMMGILKIRVHGGIFQQCILDTVGEIYQQ